MTKAIGDPVVRNALRRLDALLRARFGRDYVRLILFGSRARGDNATDSDADVAVVWRRPIEDRWRLKSRIIDEIYPIVVDTELYIQPWPVEQRELDHPERSENAALLRNILKEGLRV